MPSIAGLSMISMQGELSPQRTLDLQEITRPGVDGVAYRAVGLRGRPFRVKTVADCDTPNEAFALVQSYLSLQAQSVTMIDSAGITWADILVLQVMPQQPKRVQGKVGGLSYSSTGWVVSCDWTLQAM